jgi:hypothetical protein
MLAVLRRFGQWMIDQIVFPLTTVVPGVPFLFRRQIINGYLDLAASVKMDLNQSLVVTAMLDFTIKPWHRLADIKRLIEPQLERPAGA